MNEPDTYFKKIKTYAKRNGRITQAQKYALDHYWSYYGIPYLSATVDLNNYFQSRKPLIFEIGFGMGDSLLQMALNFPEWNFVGVEVYLPGVGRLLNQIHSYQLTNLKIMSHDAVEILENTVLENAIDGLQIFFPDPWPKKRHHKRRLIQPQFLRLCQRKLKPEGYIHIATDWPHYAYEIMKHLENNEKLVNLYEAFAPRIGKRPLTKYEKRGQQLAHPVYDMVFINRL